MIDTDAVVVIAVSIPLSTLRTNKALYARVKSAMETERDEYLDDTVAVLTWNATGHTLSERGLVQWLKDVLGPALVLGVSSFHVDIASRSRLVRANLDFAACHMQGSVACDDLKLTSQLGVKLAEIRGILDKE